MHLEKKNPKFQNYAKTNAFGNGLAMVVVMNNGLLANLKAGVHNAGY